MSGAAYDTVVVRYDKGRVRVGTPAAVNSREGFLEARGLTSESQAIAYGAKWLADHGTAVDQIDVTVQPETDALRPFGGLGKGDAIVLPDRDGLATRTRTMGRGWSGLRRNGEPIWTVTINSAAQERAAAVRRDLAGLTAGSMAGTFKAGKVGIAPSLGDVSTSALPKRTPRVADTDELSTTYPADRTNPLPLDEPGSLIRMVCAAESLVGSTDSKFNIVRVAFAADGTTKSSAVIDSFTWPGTTYRFTHVCELQFIKDQGLQLICTQAGAHALVTMQPIFSSAN